MPGSNNSYGYESDKSSTKPEGAKPPSKISITRVTTAEQIVCLPIELSVIQSEIQVKTPQLLKSDSGQKSHLIVLTSSETGIRS